MAKQFSFRLFGIAVVFLAVCAVEAAVYTVDDDGPADFSIIWKAIDFASSGDSIMVKAGTYNENINLKTGVKVLGEGRNVTRIVGTGPKIREVVVAEDVTDAQLDGFTITGAGEEMPGIRISNSSVVISNNTIEYNTDGIRIVGGSTGIIRNNIVQKNGNPNNATTDYGIICLHSTPLITNNLVLDNVEEGIYMAWAESSGAQIVNNTIVGNPYDGIWCCCEASPTIKNNIVVGNGYGIAASHDAHPVISYNDVWQNADDYNSQSGGVSAPGPGDISEDPIFDVNYPSDYYLDQRSPCIDAGDPDEVYNDIDGSRNDMGWYGGPDGSAAPGYSGITSGFVFTTIGKIPVSEITPSGTRTGLANVSKETSEDLHIYKYTDAPFGGHLWIHGLFGPDDSNVRYYQILVSKWQGRPLSPGPFEPLKDSLVKTYYTIETDGTVTSTRRTCGPLSGGAIDGLYMRTNVGYWAHPDLKMIWSSSRWADGKYTLAYKAYDVALNEVTLPDNTQDEITIIVNNTQVEAEIHNVKYDSGVVIPECGIIDLANDTENLIFTVTARHAGGYLRKYSLSALYGKNRDGGDVVTDQYVGAHDSTGPLWDGVANTPFDSSAAPPGQLDPWRNCAYQFRLQVWGRATNGYNHIHYREFNDHYYLNVGGCAWCGGADINHNGKVDSFDLGLFASRWLNKSCGPTCE